MESIGRIFHLHPALLNKNRKAIANRQILIVFVYFKNQLITGASHIHDSCRTTYYILGFPDEMNRYSTTQSPEICWLMYCRSEEQRNKGGRVFFYKELELGSNTRISLNANEGWWVGQRTAHITQTPCYLRGMRVLKNLRFISFKDDDSSGEKILQIGLLHRAPSWTDELTLLTLRRSNIYILYFRE